MVQQVRRTKTVEKILAAAGELFYRRGLRGVGIEEVIEQSGVAKSTLYVHFRAKEELVAEYLRRTDDSWMDLLRVAAEAAGPEPADKLAGVFDALLDAFDRHGFFGCPFISAAVETSLDSEARAITIRHTQRRQAWLTALSKEAGARAPDALAGQIGLLIDGALASGRLLQDRAVIDEAKSAAARLVESHKSQPGAACQEPAARGARHGSSRHREASGGRRHGLCAWRRGLRSHRRCRRAPGVTGAGGGGGRGAAGS